MKQTHSLCPSTRSMDMREADTTKTKCSTSNRGHGRILQGTVTTAGGVGGLGQGTFHTCPLGCLNSHTPGCAKPCFHFC